MWDVPEQKWFCVSNASVDSSEKHTQSKREGFKLPVSSGFNGMSGGIKVHGSTCVSARLSVKFKNCSLR